MFRPGAVGADLSSRLLRYLSQPQFEDYLILDNEVSIYVGSLRSLTPFSIFLRTACDCGIEQAGGYAKVSRDRYRH